MSQFTVSISRSDGKGNVNMNVQVEANDVIEALEVAKSTMAETIKASGLSVAAPTVPAPA